MKNIYNFFYVFTICCHLFSCKQKKESLPYAETIVHYLVNTSLRPDSLPKQIWGMPISFLGVDAMENELYFIFPRYGIKRADVLQKICQDTSDVFFAPCANGDCTFGSMQGNVDSIVPFRMPINNLKFDTNLVFRTQLKSILYSIDLKHLHKVQDTNMYYHFPNVMIVTGVFENENKAMNIGSYISKKGDTLLSSLANRLTINCHSLEQKAQALLKFVTNEIEYSYADYWYQSEIVRTAHEVLLTGLADCSGKSTLYASLLEQLDIPYCLLYYPHHMNIGVPGNFSLRNNYYFKIENTVYFEAETTTPNFVIGESRLSNGDALNTILLYQIPRKSKDIINVKTNAPVYTKWLHEIENQSAN
jgi:hypothetical protein